MTSETTFWADQIAQEISNAQTSFVVATGITPSGQIHIGNLREVVTADVAVRVLAPLNRPLRFCYIADTYDPLRRVYPFLDTAKYTEQVGRPLSDIPCPCDGHLSYAEHFLEPFLISLKRLDIRAEVVRADRLYKEGRYTENIIRSLEGTEKIRAILKEETGKETDDHWSPFNPICNRCKRMTATLVRGFDAAAKTVDYRCDCGDEGTVPMAGGGKLTWRVDWPARWQMLGVTVEPFGKDHASAGGSYDTGVRISREVFSFEPPFPIVYEWISLRGGGDMSSSKGNVIAVHDMLEVLPPDVLKYAIVKVKPNRRIVFDPGLPLLQLMDEYDDPTSGNRSARAAEISSIEGIYPLGVPFRHVVSLVQTTQNNSDEMLKILKRTGYDVPNPDAVLERAQYAKRWLEKYAPEEAKFELKPELPPEAASLEPAQKKALRLLSERLKDGMTAEEIHLLVYSVKDEAGVDPSQLFVAIYRSLLGKDRGPRAGFFLASLDPNLLRKRFEEASR